MLHQAYGRIRIALIDAVNWVHPLWTQLPNEVLLTIRNALLQYRWIYTTNYDLLTYWAIMAAERGGGFKDFFWSDPPFFDIANTSVSADPTLVLYVHGGLHLERGIDGSTCKRLHSEGESLLESFQSSPTGERWPLFVSEGTAQDKLNAIRNSDYLSFALHSLATHRGPLAVLGHALDKSDHHLIDAINHSEADPIGLGLHTESTKDINSRMCELKAALVGKNLFFFDAETHPLGNNALHVTG